MLNSVEQDMEGAEVVVSGSGNVATYAVEKATMLGAKVLTMSDSGGFIHDPDGISPEKLEWIKELINVRRGRIREYCDKYDGTSFHEGIRPWGVPCRFALPCATQNEISANDASTLVKNGVRAISEGANMPTELAGIHILQESGVLFGPAKAANAGGVAVSGLEMSQNSARISWKEDELQELLRQIMQDIHDSCTKYGSELGKNGSTDYVAGANIAGFVKVADAMLAYGVV